MLLQQQEVAYMQLPDHGEAMLQVAAAVSEDALYLLFAELEKGLEEPMRRPAAAVVLANYCASSKLDYQEHVPSLLTVRFSLLSSLSPLFPCQSCWIAVDCLAASR